MLFCCRFQIVGGGGVFAIIGTTVVVEAAVVVATVFYDVVRREGGRAHGAASFVGRRLWILKSRSREMHARQAWRGGLRRCLVGGVDSGWARGVTQPE